MYIVELRNGTVKQQLKYLLKKKNFYYKSSRTTLVSGSVEFPFLQYIWPVLSIFMLQLALFSKFFKIKMFHPQKKNSVVLHAYSVSPHNSHPSTECGLSCPALTWLSYCHRTCNRWSCRHWNKGCNKMITVSSVLWLWMWITNCKALLIPYLVHFHSSQGCTLVLEKGNIHRRHHSCALELNSAKNSSFSSENIHHV